ncbi:type IV secretion system protein VirB3 [Variovorax sp. VNK109]|jgi:type IV secretion system protein VirB3|uniref:type IV secretion system protein VirB3 n=1 Tax=Variovorax sp. VNK109 TaxID=3400919 RepID=UPI003C0D1D5F
MDKVTLIKDPLFQGVTRPAMLMGVTYEAAVFNFLFTSIGFLGTGSLAMLVICLPIHAVCFAVCARDVRYFGLIALWLKTGGRSRSRMFWGATSLSPTSCRAAAAKARYLPKARASVRSV